MANAPAADQRRLLALQELDTQIQHAAHRRRSLPALTVITTLNASATLVNDDVVSRSTEVTDLRREVAKAEDDVQSVRSRAERDAARLASGQGSSKDLVALQSEMETLARRQAVLEDVELDAMARLEDAEGALATAKAAIGELEAGLAAASAERDAAWAEIDGAIARATVERAAAVVGIDEALVALYEKLRASHDGVGAAALTHGKCGGCNMTLNPAALAAIASSSADAVARCEECGRILVRGA